MRINVEVDPVLWKHVGIIAAATGQKKYEALRNALESYCAENYKVIERYFENGKNDRYKDN